MIERPPSSASARAIVRGSYAASAIGSGRARRFANRPVRRCSLAHVLLNMSDSPPSGSLIRYMPGHRSSGTMPGGRARGMRVLSVTSPGFWSGVGAGSFLSVSRASAAPAGASGAFRGRSGLPRRAASRWASEQYRAVDLFGVNGSWQCWQVVINAPMKRKRPTAVSFGGRLVQVCDGIIALLSPTEGAVMPFRAALPVAVI
jgi:hypothetical protein